MRDRSEKPTARNERGLVVDSPIRRGTSKNINTRHEIKGNGFGYEIITNDGVANAVVCGGMGRERNLVLDKRLYASYKY